MYYFRLESLWPKHVNHDKEDSQLNPVWVEGIKPRKNEWKRANVSLCKKKVVGERRAQESMGLSFCYCYLEKNTMIIRNQHKNRNLVQKRRVEIVWFGNSTYQVVLGIAEHKLRMNK